MSDVNSFTDEQKQALLAAYGSKTQTTGTTHTMDYGQHYYPQSVCPSCGHCPHCGRGGYWGRHYYPYYPRPYFEPYITWTSGSYGYTDGTTAL